jgi:hypothetical protein
MKLFVGEAISVSYLQDQTNSEDRTASYRLGTDENLSSSKAKEFEAYPSPPSGAEARNKWSFTCIPNMSLCWSAQTFSHLSEYVIIHL